MVDVPGEASGAAIGLAEPTAETILSATGASAPRAKVGKWSVSHRAATALRGGAWTISGYIATQLLRTVATLVLARHFLGPETFGIVGLVGVFLAGLNMFSELGIVANVVQHPRGDDPEFLNTAFTIQAGRGLLIWIASAAAAYPMARFYNQPELVWLLVIAGFSELFRGLASTAAWTLTRHVKLGSITLLTVGSEAIAFGVGIIWALLSPSPWALVARTIATATVYAIGSHFIAKPRIRFGWDRAAAKDILNFGGWVSLSTAAYFLGGQGERLILGKFISPAELGCFSLAVMVSSVPAGGIGQLVNQIMLPMISATARADRPENVRDFFHARRLFFGMALVCAIGFLALGNPFVRIVLSPKYAMAGWMLQALGVRVALDVFAAPASSLVMAYGKTKYSAAGNITRLVLMMGGIWLAFAKFGIREAVLALVVAQVISYVPLALGVRRLLPEAIVTEMKYYVAFLAVAALAALVPWPGF